MIVEKTRVGRHSQSECASGKLVPTSSIHDYGLLLAFYLLINSLLSRLVWLCLEKCTLIAQKILCAILNRVTHFTAPYGSLVYLNWYAGETSTAVIVANVPHLWPLISRVFSLGAFKGNAGPSGSNQYSLKFHRSDTATIGRAHVHRSMILMVIFQPGVKRRLQMLGTKMRSGDIARNWSHQGRPVAGRLRANNHFTNTNIRGGGGAAGDPEYLKLLRSKFLGIEGSW